MGPAEILIEKLWRAYLIDGTTPEGITPGELVGAAYQSFLIDEGTYKDHLKRLRG